MSWNDTTLTTVEDLKAFENEINRLVDNSEKTYSIENDEITENITGVNLLISSSKGGANISIKSESELIIDDNVEIKLQQSNDSDDWDDVEGIALTLTAQTIANNTIIWNIPTSTEFYDYLRVIITSTSNNSGFISAYISGGFEVKISMAKKIIKNKLLSFIRLKDPDWYAYNQEAGLDPINQIHNPEVLELASTFYTLYLIYNDIKTSGSKEAYESKSSSYLDMYKIELETSLILIQYDRNQDDEIDDKTEITSGLKIYI